MTAPRDLVLIGAGGFGRETAAALGALTGRWRLLGFLDDDPALWGARLEDAPVLGGLAELKNLPGAAVAICTGRPDNYTSRLRISQALGLPDERYATIVHPSAWVAPSCSLGPGTVVLAQAVLTASVRIGAHVAVMPHVTLTHDDVVEDFATLASGVRLGGGVGIRRGAYLGAGALVREGCTVGRWALAGMGAVVTRDVPDGEIWAGVPARFHAAGHVQENLDRAEW